MKGKFNLTDKAKNIDSNSLNIFYKPNKTNNDVYFNIPYDETTFYDDYDIPNALDNNIYTNDINDDYFNKIQKILLQNNTYQNDQENDLNNITDTSVLVFYNLE